MAEAYISTINLHFTPGPCSGQEGSYTTLMGLSSAPPDGLSEIAGFSFSVPPKIVGCQLWMQRPSSFPQISPPGSSIWHFSMILLLLLRLSLLLLTLANRAARLVWRLTARAWLTRPGVARLAGRALGGNQTVAAMTPNTILLPTATNHCSCHRNMVASSGDGLRGRSTEHGAGQAFRLHSNPLKVLRRNSSIVVPPRGFEPRPHGLKGPCATN